MNQLLIGLNYNILRYNMNDKIKQLALQAGQGEPFHIPPEFIEKFAELIVRECALLCSDPVVVLQHWGLDSDSE